MSDQDFFFDEDEQPSQTPAKPAEKKSGGSQSKAKAPETAATPAGSVTMTIAALIGVVAVLLGMIVGIFIGRTLATPAITPVQSAPSGSTSAPQLTPEQMQGGTLPEGHPSVGGGTPTGTPAP